METGIDYIGICVPFYCNDGNGNFLLHRRSNVCRDEVGNWDCGSGQLEFGEDPKRAVLREVREEYGVEGEIQEQLPAHSIIRENNGVKTHWLAIPFFVKVDITKARMMEPERATDIGVFTLNNLPKPLHTGLQKTMSMYPEYFKKYKR